jgi:hypothetical protein
MLRLDSGMSRAEGRSILFRENVRCSVALRIIVLEVFFDNDALGVEDVGAWIRDSEERSFGGGVI